MLGIGKNKKLRELEIQNQELSGQTEKQAIKIQQLNIDIIQIRQALLSQENKYGWNRYTSYESAIKTIHDMYACNLEWGSSLGSMIDLRAGFIGGNGIQVETEGPDAAREKAFCEKFLKFNGFDSGSFLQFLQDFDKEGKALLYFRLLPDYEWSWNDGAREIPERGMVVSDYYGWLKYKYEILPDPENSRIAGTVKINNEPIPQERFAYRRFRGTTNEIDEAVSTWQRCLEHIVAMEKAYFDMRLNNHLFASPKPVIECKTKEDARDIDAYMNNGGKGINMKTRQVLILAGGSLKFPTPEESTDLQNEITQHRYAISFNTGIPVQFLGDPAAVRNKNVSENLMEGINKSVVSDRHIVEDLLNEACDKAMALVNGKMTPYRPGFAKLKIIDITAADWNRLVSAWMPAAESGLISKETFIDQIPGIDSERELERLEKEREEEKETKQENQEEFFNNALSNRRAEEIEGNQED